MPDSMSNWGAIKRSTTQDHLTARADLYPLSRSINFDPTGPPFLDDYPGHGGFGPGLQVRPSRDWMQERRRGAGSPPLPHGAVAWSETLLLIAVHILASRVTGLHPSLDECLEQGRVVGAMLYPQRPRITTVSVGPNVIGLRLAEVRQHLCIRPASGSHRGPFVVVECVATDVPHRIDRRRATEHFAALLPHATTVQLRLGLALVTPVKG